MSSFGEISGNFSRGLSVPLAKRMYEGLFHKLAHQNLALADGARCGCRLSSGSNRGFGGGSRGGARSCADGAKPDLISQSTDRSACSQTSRSGVDSWIPVSNQLECEAERYSSVRTKNIRNPS